MSIDAGIKIIILLAVLAANLPFINQRLFALVLLPVSMRGVRKSLCLRLLELVILYGMIGIVARVIEAHIGMAAKQSWAFYVITFSLFLVLAFPGFTYQYLYKRHG